MPLLITSKFLAYGIQEKHPQRNLEIPGTNGANQIDRIIVSKKWATDIENFRTYRGANSDSDRFLVGARLKQRLALITRNRTENRKRRNVDTFDETDVEQYCQQEVQWKLQEKPPSNNIEESGHV